MSNHLQSSCLVSYRCIFCHLIHIWVPPKAAGTQRLVSCTGEDLQTFERAGCNILSSHINCCTLESWSQSSQINGRQLKRQHDLFHIIQLIFSVQIQHNRCCYSGTAFEYWISKRSRLPLRLSCENEINGVSEFTLLPVLSDSAPNLAPVRVFDLLWPSQHWLF